MPFKPIPRELFIRYLQSLGLIPTGIRVASKMELSSGKTQLRRSIIIRPSKDRDIPAEHIRSCAKDLGKTMQMIYDEIKSL